MNQWAIKWRSENRLDGKWEFLVGRNGIFPCPVHLAGYTKMVFSTRKEARAFARESWGYITHRPDLRAEPHGWKSPQVVKVKVTVEETA